MSGKATGKVWDMRLGSGPRKTVLLAYADHADHDGQNMYPSVAMIVFKTEYSEATVHRCVKELIEMGLLVPDGTGPHNTNKYSLGCQSETLSQRHGVTVGDAGGVKSGDPFAETGDIVTPELNVITDTSDNKGEDESLHALMRKAAELAFPSKNERFSDFIWRINACEIAQIGSVITVTGLDGKAGEYQDHYAKSLGRALVGILNQETEVQFQP